MNRVRMASSICAGLLLLPGGEKIADNDHAPREVVTTGQVGEAVLIDLDPFPMVAESFVNEVLVPSIQLDPTIALVDDNGINLPNQIMVTIDGDFTMQFGLEQSSPDGIRFALFVFGPTPAMTNPEIFALDGTDRSQTGHAEGWLAMGQEYNFETMHPEQLLDHMLLVHDFLTCMRQSAENC